MSIEGSAPGDLHDPTTSPAEVARRLSVLLKEKHPRSRMTVVSRTTSTDWVIEIAIVENADDLSDENARETLLADVTREASRFGHDRSIPIADHQERDFRLRVMVHEDYWSGRQASMLDSGWRSLTPKALIGMLRRGTMITTREDGERQTVTRMAKDRFETVTDQTECTRRWIVPRAAAIMRKGDVIRFAQGNANQPDASVSFRIEGA